MRWRGGMAALIVLGAAVAWPVQAADTWRQISAPGFEFYTATGTGEGVRTVQMMTNIRSFFLKASPVRNLRNAPLRIVQFRNIDEFQKYNPNPAAAAYFMATPQRDYIVLGPSAEDSTPMVVHEYVHRVVRQSGLRLPLWLSEGWAEVYSTLRAQGKETAVGDLIPARMETLKDGRWLDFETLTTASAESGILRDPTRAGMFYAESWALAHMLYLAPEYQAGFGKFINELQAGRSTAESCEAAFGRSSEQVYADLTNYLSRKKMTGRIYATPFGDDREMPKDRVLTDVERTTMLAELLAAAGKTADAESEYQKLEQGPATGSAVPRALGELALQRRDEDGALAYFEKAFDAGEQDPVTCYRLALLEQKKGQVLKMIAALERAVRSKPDFTEAKILLGLGKADMRDFDGALKTLLAIEEIRPETAPAVFCALATAYTQTGDFEAAREHLATCGKWAKADVEKDRVKQVGIFLDARAEPAAAVRKGEKHGLLAGTAVAVECPTSGKRLRVQIENKVALFDLPSLDAIEMIAKVHPTFSFECGPITPTEVGVEFAPPLTAIGNSAGIVRRLVY